MNRMKFTIRLKLLFLSIAILSIPYFGFEYLREMERYLQDALESSLVDAARAVAAPLSDQVDLFPEVDSDDRGLYIHDFIHPILLDGYSDDWISYLSWSDVYSEEPGRPVGKGDRLSYKIIVGHFDQYINVLLQVKDRNIVYQEPGETTSINNDHIELVFTNNLGKIENYFFSPAAPGSIRPFQYRILRDEFNIEYKTTEFKNNINGELQPTADGYNLEILIPARLAHSRMGFVVFDVDNPVTREQEAKIGTSGKTTDRKPGRLVKSSPEVKRLIDKLPKADGRRIWVLDKQGSVLSSTGNLEKTLPTESINPLYTLVLPSVSERFSDDLMGASRLEGQEVKIALKGGSGTNWRLSPDERAVILSATAPIRIEGIVRGVVYVEETTNSIQMVQRQAMKSLFNKSIVYFALVTSFLLFFATRLSVRLRRLSREAERAIDEHGRVIADFRDDKSSDEIGELSRNYALMLERLKEYNQYLESMSGRLSHELRTPITVVQSSLDHLQSSDSTDDKSRYLERAREGIERLNLIVIRLSEATRLEQAMHSAGKEQTDITGLLRNCIEGYRLAYPDRNFILNVPGNPVVMMLASDLIVQMLDKLVDNAMDFSSPESPVEIEFLNGPENCVIKVTNFGSRLPEKMDDQIFNSMISVRATKSREGPHLGLGLYIVRLIAEFHGAVVRVESGVNEDRVSFIIEFQ